MKRFAQEYVAFVRQPDVGRLLLVALLTRMPIGMGGFAMVMYLREALGNFALAGTAVGVYFMAMAAVAPIVGRIIDRRGPRAPLIVTGIVQPLALLAVFFSARMGLPFAWIVASAALGGMFAPPITTLIRTSWRYRFDQEDDRRTAFALDAVMIEINFALGPAIVAAILATAGAPAAFLTTIAVAFAAFLIFMASPALTYFKRAEPAERHLLGPLTEPRLLLVFVVTFGLALCFGIIEVGYPAYGTALAMPALAGVLLSVNSIGSVLGGAIFGGLRLKTPVERQLAAAMGLMAFPLFLHAVVDPPVAWGIVAFLTGMLIAPSIAAQSVLVSRLAPAKYATEAFTWSSTFIVSGLGAGLALGGWIIETTGLRSAFITASAVIAAMALVALLISSPRAGSTVTQASR